MKTVKTSELSGRALDWAVAKYQKIEDCLVITHASKTVILDDMIYSPSTNWTQCGVFVNQLWIEISVEEIDGVDYWYASPPHLVGDYATGSTPQEAICRAVAMVEFGDTVEIPEELLE